MKIFKAYLMFIGIQIAIALAGVVVGVITFTALDLPPSASYVAGRISGIGAMLFACWFVARRYKVEKLFKSLLFFVVVYAPLVFAGSVYVNYIGRPVESLMLVNGLSQLIAFIMMAQRYINPANPYIQQKI